MSSATHSAVLLSWAAKLNLVPDLASVTLANVFSGETCTPISLRDFEEYLTYREHAVENLHFVLWFQDYRQRFLALESVAHASKLESSNVLGPYTPYRGSIGLPGTEERHHKPSASADTSISKATLVSPKLREQSEVTESTTPNYVPTPITGTINPLALRIPSSPLSSVNLDSERIVSAITLGNELPFREECMRAAATFLRPQASKELNLDAAVRDDVLRKLDYSTHPDVFKRAYEDVYGMLEMVSLPRFLTQATANINLTKQIFYTTTGIAVLTLAVILSICLIVILPTPPQANRCWRIFALPGFGLGGMLTYSGFQGFCSQIWARGGMQLRSWELDELSDEAKVSWTSGSDARSSRNSWYSHKRHNSSISYFRNEPFGTNTDSQFSPISSSKGNPSPAIIAPFAEPSLHEKFPRVSGRDNRPQSRGVASTLMKRKFRRPPIFGPERDVLDPRIRAVHKQIVITMYLFGFWCTVLCGAIVLAVPGRHH